MYPPDAATVLVRHGELGTKSDQVQRHMERILQENLQNMLEWEGVDATVERERGRIFLRSPEDEIDAAIAVARRTFGVISASVCLTVDPTLEAIKDGLDRTAQRVPPDGPFAISARRVGDATAHSFRSADIEEQGGAAVWKALEARQAPSVDLEDPAQTYYVECREDEAYIFLDKPSGPGGFPYGTQGNVVTLISGGIDSPVAAWEAMRRGCTITPVYFDFEDYGGPDHVARAFESVRQLATYVPEGTLSLFVVPIGDPVDSLVEAVGATRMLSLRRLMFATAERIAYRVGAHALVTGESIGQKSSQTGQNIAVTSADTTLPIHRPLLDRDKSAIVGAARSIGTYQNARIEAGCNRVAPSFPETRATRAQVVAAEPDGFFRAIEEAVDAAEQVAVSPRYGGPTMQELSI